MRGQALYKIIFALAVSMAIGRGVSAEAAPQSKQFDAFESYAGTGYDQHYRPLFNFTSLRNWINDPNGLLYYDGEYHLFFQHNHLGQVTI